MTVVSDRIKFLSEPTMMLKTFDNEVIKLQGYSLDNSSQSVDVVIGNVIVPATTIYTTALFEVTDDQFELIGKGISIVRVELIPMYHERTFKKDKIGKKLHSFYQKKREKEEEF